MGISEKETCSVIDQSAISFLSRSRFKMMVSSDVVIIGGALYVISFARRTGLERYPL